MNDKRNVIFMSSIPWNSKDEKDDEHCLFTRKLDQQKNTSEYLFPEYFSLNKFNIASFELPVILIKKTLDSDYNEVHFWEKVFCSPGNTHLNL